MVKTLIVDGNNLLKIGFHGVKDFYNNGEHVGGTWYFLNTIRKFLEETNFNKVMVFWDSDTNSSQRKLIYPKYHHLATRAANSTRSSVIFSVLTTLVLLALCWFWMVLSIRLEKTRQRFIFHVTESKMTAPMRNNTFDLRKLKLNDFLLTYAKRNSL